MPVRRISRAVLVYIAIAVAEFIAVLIIGGAGVSIPSLVLAVILFSYLYLGKPLAWWILLAMNTVGLLALGVLVISDLAGSRHVLWGNVIVLVCTTSAMEAALLSTGMRRHVASRGLRLAPHGVTEPAVRPRP